MADLIDRDAALKKFIEGDGDDDFTTGYNWAVDEYRQKIAEIPAVNRWIPCSERLPGSDDDVLVWFEYYRYGDYDRLYQTYGIGNYFSHHDNWLIDKSTGWRDLRVIAWMPLPEPPEKE